MSGGLDVLALQDADVSKMLSAGVHLGASNADFQMLQYVYKRKSDGTHIINLKKTWEKLLLAARIIVAVENPADVCVISGKTHAQRAILKFSTHTGANPVAGRYTPGGFTNQIQKAFREPRLLIISDPRVDHQAINESSYVNIPTIAFCNTDSSLRHIDVAIPCNTKSHHAIGVMWWMLSREVLRLRGTISRDIPWERTVMPDLYFYRDPDEVEREEQEAAAALKAASSATGAATTGTGGDDWGGAQAVPTLATGDDWGEAPSTTPAAAVPAAAPAPGATDDWGQPSSTDWAAEPSGGDQPAASTSDWAASTTGSTTNW